MYYPKLALVIALLSICSFTLVYEPSIKDQPVINLLLNGEPVDINDLLSLNCRGHFDILVLEEAPKQNYRFTLMLIRDHKPVAEPVNLYSRETFRSFPIKEVLALAKFGDRLVVEISNAGSSIYYNMELR